MATKLQQLLDELKELPRVECYNDCDGYADYRYNAEEKGDLIESILIDQLITKYTETINYSESDNICDNCKFCIGCKNDDGRWVVCNNEKNRTYIKEIDRSFGCILFEPIN